MAIRTNGELGRELKGQSSARFCLCDFHVHSPASHDVVGIPELSTPEKQRLAAFLGDVPTDWVSHQQEVLTAFQPSEYLANRRDEVVTKLGIGEYNKWAIIAISDNNICTYAVQLARAAWNERKKNKLIVLPGIVLDVVFPISANESTITYFPRLTIRAFPDLSARVLFR